MKDNLKIDTEKIIKKLKKQINNTNPYETLAYFYSKYYTNRIVSNSASYNESNIKELEFLQRLYYDTDIVHGNTKPNYKKILNLLDDYQIGILVSQYIESDNINSNKDILNSSRSTISFNIHPFLFSLFYKDVNEYMIIDTCKREEVNQFIDLIASKATLVDSEIFALFSEGKLSELKNKYIISEYPSEITNYIQTKEENINPNDVNLMAFLKDSLDNIYLFSVHLLIDNYYYMLKKQITNNLSVEKFNLRQNKMTEELTVKYLNKLLKSAQIFTNVEYTTRTGKYKNKNTCELDILIEIDDVLIVTEVKGGLLYQKDFSEDKRAIEKNLNDLLENPLNQGKRFLYELRQKGKIKIKNTNKTIVLNDYTEVYILNITMEHLDSVATNYYKSMDTDYYALSIPLSDLYQYTFLFEDEVDFLNYLLQRSRFDRNHNVHIHDEFIHYGLYTMHNNYSNWFSHIRNEHEISYQYSFFDTDSYLEISNKYITNKCSERFSNDDVFKPNIKLPQVGERHSIVNLLISNLNRSNNRKNRKLVRNLLDLDYNDIEEIYDMNARLIDLINEKYSNSNMTLHPMFLFSFGDDNEHEVYVTTVNEKNDAFKKLNEYRKYFTLRVDKDKVCIVIEMNENKVENIRFVECDYGEIIFEKCDYLKAKYEYESLIKKNKKP